MPRSNLPRFVVLAMPQVHSDLAEIHRYISLHSPQNANLVVGRLIRAMESLETLPRRHGRAREAREFDGELRQVVVSGYRVIYEVVDERVEVLTVIHGGRRRAEGLST